MHYAHGGNVHRFLRQTAGTLDSVLDFSANINPLGISPMGKEAMLSGLDWLSHYPDPEYIALKEKMSIYYKVDLAGVSVFNGAAEGLHELFRYLKPVKAMIPVPAFVEYEKALKIHNTAIEWFYLKEEEAFQLDEERFLMAIEMERPDLVVICTPNNPTGRMTGVNFLEQLAGQLKRWKGNLLVDEAFLDFLPSHADSAAKWLKLHENLYVLKSFTKFFGVPGLRLGAVLTDNRAFHERMDQYGVPWRINAMAERYALGALGDEAYIQESRSFIQNESLLLREALSKLKNIKCYDSAADYLLFKIESMRAEAFEKALNEQGILIRNCSNYRGLTEGYFRMAIKDHQSNHRLLQAMEEVLG